ncbi:hypothetical protein [Fructilactobacillus fructivorans]|uniref:Holin n=1 Tax=Fructilactobacillus fructivorans TaxID=1614 RepID=A0AAE6P021_9LACO|nr:hypothetical protein [Fructilactobacillus fructivorans]KRK58514.1 hypothetical protein FC73_GL000069 [Fructilactobacillus fructivorans]KRN13359.1 hypothetical protein IV37_GL000075 [Fructilactobacillus fructivorans]KRN40068.1 hypothetical protein IV51_GL000249 [Fructilactobacillus fructivorans]KRN41829.1 hypothetical protein IV48_GL000671 [Fructilactobacillus fructivorans]QFX92524.1 holin [Fructilactobacillus fructivorans]
MKKLHIKIRNDDGSLNGVVLSSVTSLGLVAIQEILQAFGITPPVSFDQLTGIINTIFTILGILGVINNVQRVTDDGSSVNKKGGQNEKDQ